MLIARISGARPFVFPSPSDKLSIGLVNRGGRTYAVIYSCGVALLTKTASAAWGKCFKK
jgi:hypothetical protein